MRTFSSWGFLAAIVLFGCNPSDENSSEISEFSSEAGPVFKLLNGSTTGITFTNNITDQPDFNILTYRNFYNGGGVAVGDINNDGLPDLYFTANQGPNKLYLNRGDLQFEDISESAGISGSKSWSTEVVMADVNADGLLDIYVCNSGDVSGQEKENELFINNGDLTFSERATEFNLNNQGYSTHAAFFDYDFDGDLDCYILNNSFKDPSKIELYKKVRETEVDPGGDKLMRNDGDTFTDVTVEAGIYSSIIGFGLGVAIGDLNNDMYPDIYISNDFWERDYLYINLGNGKFKEELNDRLDYCSVSSMGADIADLNNDGYPEIFTTDMLAADNYRIKATMAFDPYHLEDLKYRSNFHYQIIQNCLHLNNGEAQFQEVAALSGVAATDWSWGALIFDFENDGYRDIFVSNGIGKDIMYMDFRDFLAQEQSGNLADSRSGEDHLNSIKNIPSQPLKNFAFSYNGDLSFRLSTDELGLGDPSFSNGSVYADLDNDGDLDLVVNNVNMPAFIYENRSVQQNGNHFLKIKFAGPEKNKFGIGAKVIVKIGDQELLLENFNNRGFESSIEPHLLFGTGKNMEVDELKITWPDQKIQILNNVKTDQTLTLNYKEAVSNKTGDSKPKLKTLYHEVSSTVIKGNSRHVENRYNDFDHELLLSRMLSTEGPRAIVGDVNNDRLEDFILLGASDDPDKLFIQQNDGSFQRMNNSILGKDSGFESTCGELFDFDGDGDQDLMIGAGGNEYGRGNINFLVRLYINDGKGNYVVDPEHIPPVIGNFSTLNANDFDNDGDMDIFLGGRLIPGNYGLPPQSYLLRNDNGSWTNVASEEIGNAGLVTDAIWTDLDNDNDDDLVIVGEWMPIKLFYNENGRFTQKVIENSSGWWTRVYTKDMDNDGFQDLILGNWGENTKFQASINRPMSMVVNDFDNNGKSEFIISWYPPLDSLSYPFISKPELTTQLASLRKKALKYDDYARFTIDSLFTDEMIESGYQYESTTLKTSIAWNQNDGTFNLIPLPWQIQVSPAFGFIIEDMDNDNFPDIWAGGNFYALKPQVGRQNANKGVFLKGIGNRKFSFVSTHETGLAVSGEVRDAKIIQTKNGPTYLVTRNNDLPLIFKKNK